MKILTNKMQITEFYSQNINVLYNKHCKLQVAHREEVLHADDVSI